MAKQGAMQKFMDWMQEHIMPVAGKIAEEKHITAITKGMMATIPLTIIGGISLILAYPPVDASTLEATSGILKSFLTAWYNWAGKYAAILELPNNVTLGLLGIYVVIAITYHLCKNYKMEPLSCMITSAMSFLIIAAPPAAVEGASGLFLNSRYLGSRGLFAAMVVAIVTVELTRFLLDKNIKIKLPDTVPPMVTAPFEALIPSIVVLVAFLVVDQGVTAAFGVNLPQAIMNLFTPFAKAVDSVCGMMAIQFLINFLWFFGIYGSAVPDSVTSGFFMTNITANAAAYAAGEPLPAIATAPFRTAFGNIGGCGSAFALAICILLVAKSTQLKTVGKIGIVPSIFGIAEPLTFGVPLVFNPILMVPMILGSVLNTMITFLLMQWNIIGRIFVNIPWTTPRVLDAILCTMDVKAGLLVIALVVMDVLIYMPFVKVYDKSLLEKEKLGVE